MPLRDYHFTFELSYKGRRWQTHDLTRVRARNEAAAWATARRLIAKDYTSVNPAFNVRNIKLTHSYEPKNQPA